jgi:hypothetical protein
MKIKQTLNRFYVHDIEQSIEFYEKVLNEKCNLRFKYSQVNLELAQIGNILILAGSDEALKPFRDTQATFEVTVGICYDVKVKKITTIFPDETQRMKGGEG